MFRLSHKAFAFALVFVSLQSQASSFSKFNNPGDLSAGLATAAELLNSIPHKNSQYPIGPEPELTMGSLCENPTDYRYGEGIAYCRRNVTTSIKNAIINTYDKTFGYHIREMNRSDFKIDHLIPLCAGGSNETNNLWPQHKSVYEVTDPLEPEICNKMALGRLKQKEAVETVLRAKLHLDEVPEILDWVRSL